MSSSRPRSRAEKRPATISDDVFDALKLDDYEREILDAYESGKLKSIATKADLERYRAAARATLRKDRRVNVRLASMDVEGLRARAAEEGMPYQTLIASVLHKYVAGRLVEKPRPAPKRKRA